MKPKKLEFFYDGRGIMIAENELGSFRYMFRDPVYHCYTGENLVHQTPDVADAINFLQSENDKAARTLFEPDTLTPKLVAYLRETVEAYRRPGFQGMKYQALLAAVERGQELLKLAGN